MDKNDIRNKLIINTVEFIKKTMPDNIIIENVNISLKEMVLSEESKVGILSGNIDENYIIKNVIKMI